MNEKQAKRIRRAMRAHVRAHEQSLDAGPRAEHIARRLARIVRNMWGTLVDHRSRGRVGTKLAAGDLLGAASHFA